MSGMVIQADRACVRCGYNLRGLSIGGVCPECGTPIASKRERSRLGDSLTDAPRWYLKLLILGLVLLNLPLAGLVLSVAAIFGGPFVFFIGAIVMIAGALGWPVGAFIVTVKRPRSESTLADAALDSEKLRLAIRITQAMPIAAWGLSVGAGFGAPAWLAIVGAVLNVAWVFSLIPFCLYLAALADWSSESRTGDRLRGVAWTLAVPGTLFAGSLVAYEFGLGIALWIAILSGLATFVSIVVFYLGLLQLVQSAMWALSNSKAIERRAERMAIRRAEAEQQAAIEEAQREAQIADQINAPSIEEQRASGNWVAGRISSRRAAEMTGEEPAIPLAGDNVPQQLRDEPEPEKPEKQPNPYALEGED
ncbi:MAG: hypothetical protein AAFR38_11735 [Planctomycetota bacterium]